MANNETVGARRTNVADLSQSEDVLTEPRRPAERLTKQPRDIADWSRLQGDRRKGESGGLAIETFTLPLEAARGMVRDIIGRTPQRGHLGIVERWRQLPDGLIEFTMRRLPASD